MPIPVQTEKHGQVVFVKTFVNGIPSKSMKEDDPKRRFGPSGHIGITSNGTYCHWPSGLPITSEEEGIMLLQAVNPAAVEPFCAWWRQQQEIKEAGGDRPAPRAILIMPDGRLLYADTKAEVESLEDLYAFFPPKSKVLEFALGLHRDAEEKRQLALEEKLLSLSQARNEPKGFDAALMPPRSGKGQFLPKMKHNVGRPPNVVRKPGE